MGSVILSVSAEDPDVNTTVTYRLSEDADGLVTIDPRTGTVFLPAKALAAVP